MMQQLAAFYAAGGALAGALAALALYHAAVVRPALTRYERLLAVHDGMIGGGAGGAADRLAALEIAEAALQNGSRELAGRVYALEALSKTDVSRFGFVRYDAFGDSGDGLSYALALLNREGDGVVITSIHSPADTRTYGKPVAGFTPTVQASEEELKAIARARAAPS